MTRLVVVSRNAALPFALNSAGHEVLVVDDDSDVRWGEYVAFAEVVLLDVGDPSAADLLVEGIAHSTIDPVRVLVLASSSPEWKTRVEAPPPTGTAVLALPLTMPRLSAALDALVTGPPLSHAPAAVPARSAPPFGPRDEQLVQEPDAATLVPTAADPALDLTRPAPSDPEPSTTTSPTSASPVDAGPAGPDAGSDTPWYRLTEKRNAGTTSWQAGSPTRDPATLPADDTTSVVVASPQPIRDLAEDSPAPADAPSLEQPVPSAEPESVPVPPVSSTELSRTGSPLPSTHDAPSTTPPEMPPPPAPLAAVAPAVLEIELPEPAVDPEPDDVDLPMAAEVLQQAEPPVAAVEPHGPPVPHVISVVRALTHQIGEVSSVSDTAAVVAAEVRNVLPADAVAVLVRDGLVWRVAAGHGLRPLEHRIQLAPEHWLVQEVSKTWHGVLLSGGEGQWAELYGAPLSHRTHLLAAPLPPIGAILLLARDDEPFAEGDLEGLLAFNEEAGHLLSDATDVRRLARLLRPFCDDEA